MNFEISGSSIRDGFYVSKKKNSDYKSSVNIILKPNTIEKVYVIVYGANGTKSKDIKGIARLNTGK